MSHGNDDVRFTSSSFKIPVFQPQPPVPFFSQALMKTRNSLSQLIDSLKTRSTHSTRSESLTRTLHSAAELLLRNTYSSLTGPTEVIANFPLLCSASLSLSQSPAEGTAQSEPPSQQQKGQSHTMTRSDEERVLISEVLVRNKDGEELERKDLEIEALTALKACRANSALTVREVQEDVHRIIDSGYFCSCMPVAVDTRDGIRLIFQVLCCN